ncbi:MAG: UDP-N-acetylmuramoyl-L-alanine--D-glutamate ligase [Chitinophagales bacterium]|nr:UDP-N-acetylmuramoyl-L-alanine--D-glutamate ligase [Chitinophagales bacterium]
MNGRLVILGAGESGIGAAILGKNQGWQVFVSDLSPIKEKYAAELQDHAIDFEEGKHSTERILAADLVIKSPGIPDKAPLIKQIIEKGISIISEIEFAYRYCKGEIIAITGSNGKTTTTALIHHILQKAGFDVALGGNIGTSFARLVAEKDYLYYVIEISSFQLDGCYTFKPKVAILTNITEDHLDRYEYKFENYIRSKFRITQAQSNTDYLMFCDDDPVTQEWINQIDISAHKIGFSIQHTLREGSWKEASNLIFKVHNNQFEMDTHELALSGLHNTYNSMAAGIAAKLMGVRKEVIRESLQDFKNLDHRMEFVATIRGVDFINDSKATNVNSAWYALESMTKQVIWIAGGVDKGNDYTLLKDLVRNKVKAIVCLGKDNEVLHQAFSEDVGYIVDTNSAEEAVNMAFNLAEKGEAVLLSPACASFDLFENYEDRGRQFRRSVLSL